MPAVPPPGHATELDYKESSEDEEVKLLSHRTGADEPDLPGADIRKVPEASNTRRDEWLLKTEALQGARPKWNKGGRPPVVPDQKGVVYLEAAGVWLAGTWNNAVLRPLCCHWIGRPCRRRK